MKKIYHITTSSKWNLAKKKGVYDFCSLESDGFIHCSTADQVLSIANYIFSGCKDIILLEIDEDKIGQEVKYENLEGGSKMFPHVYGPIPIKSITSALEMNVNEKGDFILPDGV